MSQDYSTKIHAQEGAFRVPSARALVGLLLGAGVLLYLLTIWFDWAPWLRGWRFYPEGWTWLPNPTPPIERFIPVAVAIGGIWVTLVLSEYFQVRTGIRHSRAGKQAVTAFYLILMIAFGCLLQLGLLELKNEKASTLLVEQVTNRVNTGYFTYALASPDPARYFNDYPYVFTTKLCPHCHNHPPGGALFYWTVIRAASKLPADWQSRLAGIIWDGLGTDSQVSELKGSLSDTALIAALGGGVLILLLASCTVIPLLGIARLLAPPGYGFRLAALGLALPGLLLMSPQFDQILALFSATALYFGLLGLAANSALRSGLWGAAAGLTIAVGMYFSWSFIPLTAAMLAIGLAVMFVSRYRLPPKSSGGSLGQTITPARLVAWAVGLALGIAALLGGLILVTHVDLPYIFQYNLQNDVRTEAQRPYQVWLFFGPLDFIQFYGVPLAVTTLLSLRLGRRKNDFETNRETDPEDLDEQTVTNVPWYGRVNFYALIFWLTLLAIDLAGKSKAEQGRTLIFLMPLGLTAVYFWAGRTTPPRSIFAWLFFAQMLVCVLIGAKWVT